MATWATSEEALERVSQIFPDVVLMDIDLPRGSSIGSVRELKKRQPGMQIVMLTLLEDHCWIYDSLVAGASGYVLKYSSPLMLRKSVSDFHQLKSTISAILARRVLENFGSNTSLDTPATSLSCIERTILDMVAEGQLYKAVEEKIGMKKGDIRIYLHIIYAKLQFRMNSARILSRPAANPFA